MNLKDKVAIVTGSARGIGKAIALQMAEKGAHLVISDLMVEEGEQVVKKVKSLGREALWIKANVSKRDEAELLVQKAVEKFNRIDILVNNAGITRDNLIMRMSEDEWDSVLAVNLKGAYNCIQAITKPFMKQRSGKIINIASVVGIIGNAGQANYAASKAGIIGLTKAVAKELATRNVCVNAVAPGFIQTQMTENLPEKAKERLLANIPLAKLGQAKDVATAVCFLADESSNYITGQVLNVDGGMVM
jgi:3-oxoacyl-[acyl-carrier protein] reductase